MEEGLRPKKRFVKSHTKSRLGCSTCKQRRVKCDEVHPVCGSCSRRNTDCVWPDFTKPAGSPASQSEERNLALVGQSYNPSPSPASPLTPSMSLDMTILKLMHHYSLVTSTTLYHNPPGLFANQFVIPSMAFREPTIMHALLALTSIHLHALYHPLGIADQDYLNLAQRHKNEALALSLAPTYTPSSPDSRMVTRNFLIIYKVAESLGTTDGPPTIFSLIDTVRNALHDQEYFYRDEQLQPLNYPFYGKKIVPTEAEEEAINVDAPPSLRKFPPFLKQLHLPTAPYPEPEELLDSGVAGVYKQCIGALRDSWYMCQYHPSTGLAGTVAWIVRMTDRFRNFLVVERRPRALVVLYYYCVMLELLDMQYHWWARKRRDCLAWIGMMLPGQWMEVISMENSKGVDAWLNQSTESSDV